MCPRRPAPPAPPAVARAAAPRGLLLGALCAALSLRCCAAVRSVSLPRVRLACGLLRFAAHTRAPLRPAPLRFPAACAAGHPLRLLPVRLSAAPVGGCCRSRLPVLLRLCAARPILAARLRPRPRAVARRWLRGLRSPRARPAAVALGERCAACRAGCCSSGAPARSLCAAAVCARSGSSIPAASAECRMGARPPAGGPRCL